MSVLKEKYRALWKYKTYSRRPVRPPREIDQKIAFSIRFHFFGRSIHFFLFLFCHRKTNKQTKTYFFYLPDSVCILIIFLFYSRTAANKLSFTQKKICLLPCSLSLKTPLTLMKKSLCPLQSSRFLYHPLTPQPLTLSSDHSTSLKLFSVLFVFSKTTHCLLLAK